MGQLLHLTQGPVLLHNAQPGSDASTVQSALRETQEPRAKKKESACETDLLQSEAMNA